ncbi:hypothetical protein [Salmonella enterica]|uniref:hypothetical protein n=1 Tax=Salmonella enterica TaxID=28901 RepID=UPI003626D903
MASNWIKVEVITPDKPEIYHLAERLSLDPDAVLGKLIRLWVWADQQTIDGNANCNAASVTKNAIDRITFATGFADALISVGWLTESDGKLSIPNFERHNGESSKKRALTNNRVTKVRETSRKCNAESVTESDQKALPEEEEEKETDLKDHPPKPPYEGDVIDGEKSVKKNRAEKFNPLSVGLPDWLPAPLWSEWVAFRRALGKPVKTPQGATGLIRKLDEYRQQGFSPGVVIRHSIANEYRGLFAPDSGAGIPPGGNRGRDSPARIQDLPPPDSEIPPGFRG